MNKVFKVKRNARGQMTVCSEMAKSHGKGKVVVALATLAFVASANVSAQTVSGDPGEVKVVDADPLVTFSKPSMIINGGTVADSGGGSAIAMNGGTATGVHSIAMGNSTTASAQSSTAMGRSTTASGEYSTAMGWSTTASGE